MGLYIYPKIHSFSFWRRTKISSLLIYVGTKRGRNVCIKETCCLDRNTLKHHKLWNAGKFWLENGWDIVRLHQRISFGVVFFLYMCISVGSYIVMFFWHLLHWPCNLMYDGPSFFSLSDTSCARKRVLLIIF